MTASGYICHTCKANLVADAFVIYDDHKERYYCDDDCFEAWAEEDEDVIDFYRRLNTSYVQV
jgi:hypothetical protein